MASSFAHPATDTLERNLARLKRRIPDAPLQGVLMSRLLLRLGKGIASLLEHELKPFGLAEAEFRVLTTLFSQPDGAAHPGELCASAAQSPANISRISDCLLEREFITRESSMHDRRKTVLRITAHGEATVRELLPRLFRPLRDIFEGVATDDLERMIGQMKQLSVRMDAAVARNLPERAS